jgi:hypothetical protein
MNKEDLLALLDKLEKAKPCDVHGKEYLYICRHCEDVLCEKCRPICYCTYYE